MKSPIISFFTTLALGIAGCTALAGVSQAAGLMSAQGGQGPAPKIQSHHVVATIENGYAITEVTQVFRNSQQQDLEATYHFPVPDKAAVSEFTVWIDGQPVVGEVLKKEQANRVYEAETAAGREAGITSKNRHYNFSTKVAPIRAGEDTRIRLVYMQPVDMDTGVGRYVYPLEDGQTDDHAAAFWTADTTVQEDFSFTLNLTSGYPVTDVRVPGQPHAIVTHKSDQEWQVVLGSDNSINNLTQIEHESESVTEFEMTHHAQAARANPASLDKDIVTYWRLAAGLPGSVDLVTHKEPGSERGTFMLTLTPGDDLARITNGRDWVFVLDMSGSMSGKYQTLTEGVRRALSSLPAEDRFRIIRFNNRALELTHGWINSTPSNIDYWSNELAASSTGGSTNLYAGTEKGLRALDADRTSAIVLVTDGEANVGTTEKAQFLKIMQKYDVRLFTAVMGNGANRPLLEAMTEVSNGFAVSVSNSDDIVGKLMEFTSKATHQALHDVELTIKGVKTANLTPEVTTTLYRGEQLLVLGHYWGGGEATLALKGKISGQKQEYKTRFNFPMADTAHPELERLWAYARIRDLQDMADYLGDDSEYKVAIEDLAVNNSLVTDYTSMVVMRDEQFEARGIERKNRDRRARETAAAAARKTSPVVSNRVDTSEPAFTSSRASYSGSGSNGGGALHLELLLLAPFAFLALLRRCRS